jgi:hypothetical protein
MYWPQSNIFRPLFPKEKQLPDNFTKAYSSKSALSRIKLYLLGSRMSLSRHGMKSASVFMRQFSITNPDSNIECFKQATDSPLFGSRFTIAVPEHVSSLKKNATDYTKPPIPALGRKPPRFRPSVLCAVFVVESANLPRGFQGTKSLLTVAQIAL